MAVSSSFVLFPREIWRQLDGGEKRRRIGGPPLNLEAVVLGGGDFQQENPTLNKGGERRTLANSHKVLTDFVFSPEHRVCSVWDSPCFVAVCFFEPL